MEGSPKQESGAEGGLKKLFSEIIKMSDAELEADAQKHFEIMLATIDGYEDMSLEDKRQTLPNLMNTLPEADEEAFNKFRYLNYKIALGMSVLDRKIEIEEAEEEIVAMTQ